MKSFVQVIFILMAVASVPALATPEQDADFADRCSAPGVVRCIGFDSDAEAPMRPTEYTNDPAPFGLREGKGVPPSLDTTSPASGNSALKFTFESNSGGDAGSFWANFSDDFSVQFGEGSPHGKEFYVQWREKFSPDFLDTIFYSDYANRSGKVGWKQTIIGQGDSPTKNIHSCTDLEIVTVNGGQRGFPGMYHSCGAKDGRYEPLQEPYGSFDFLLQNAIREPDICSYHFPNIPPCVGYEADQWMTFQVHVIIGTPYTNNRVYKHDSTIQLWVAYEGQPARLVMDYSPKDPECQAIQQSLPKCQTGYDLYNKDPLDKHYGQIWLLPYTTNKDSSQPHPTVHTWYDELIVSTSRIADPGVPRDAVPPAAPTGVDVQ